MNDKEESEAPSFTPQDAFGLLRSYSRHRDYVRLGNETIGEILLPRLSDGTIARKLLPPSQLPQ